MFLSLTRCKKVHGSGCESGIENPQGIVSDSFLLLLVRHLLLVAMHLLLVAMHLLLVAYCF